MAVKLESVHPSRTRYLVVVSRMGRRAEESCLLGIDCNEKTTVGLVLRVLADTAITLDGDGGFSVSVYGRHHIFKPVSVQAMWSALQTLHKASSKAREENYFQGGLSHDWVDYYEQRIESDRSCLNEWHAMEDLESRRPPSPDSIRTKPCKRDETEKVIRSTLKEIMMCVDLDEVTSKYIRNRLEEELDMDLTEYKPFIDQEMLTILGQMDAPTEIFDHVYLGSEWNASNYEELKRNGVRHILNVTREIDNFFPGTFDYLNIRVYDDEKTDLLKYWDNTYKYITKAKTEGSKVLVHCKMGISRSASVVIAYAMKAYNWDFKTAMQHVKEKRTCIKPNVSFVAQLETYQGILDAMKNKEKLQRSKSETNLKSPERTLPGSQPTPLLQALSRSAVLQTTSGQDLRQLGSRPKSWSPENISCNDFLLGTLTPFRSLENLNRKSLSKESLGSLRRHKSATKLNSVVRNVLLPCDNGESYSVSPNQIRHLPGQLQGEKTTVKQIVNEFEAQKDVVKECRKKLVSNNLVTPEDSGSSLVSSCNNLTEEAQLRLTPPMSRAVLVKKETWDPGEHHSVNSEGNNDSSNNNFCDFNSVDNKKLEQTIWTSSTVLQTPSELQTSAVQVNKVPDLIQNKTKALRRDSDVFSNQVDRVFDREEKRQQRITTVADSTRNCPSRQSSWGSYDSAVVLGESRDLLSRHSSWGSGDTRTLPSRNSSWGSYDMRPGGFSEKSEKVLNPEEWGAYTTKRNDTVEALNIVLIQEKEDAVSLNDTGRAISAKIDIINPKRNSFISSCRLSVSAPENSSIDIIKQECAFSRSTNVINTAQCFSVKQHKNFLENLSRDINIIKKPDDLPEPDVGIVKNLKKEFEAKTNQDVCTIPDDVKPKSVPSSPVEKSPSRTNSEEDLSFKKLIGKFELNTKDNQVNRRPKLFSSQKLHKNSRFSCIEVSTDKNPIRVTQTPLIKNIERPPVPPIKNPSPNVVVATVIAKAAMKQQQYGKSHPLARINIKPRHNNPVYNTM